MKIWKLRGAPKPNDASPMPPEFAEALGKAIREIAKDAFGSKATVTVETLGVDSSHSESKFEEQSLDGVMPSDVPFARAIATIGQASGVPYPEWEQATIAEFERVRALSPSERDEYFNAASVAAAVAFRLVALNSNDCQCPKCSEARVDAVEKSPDAFVVKRDPSRECDA